MWQTVDKLGPKTNDLQKLTDALGFPALTIAPCDWLANQPPYVMAGIQR